MKAWLMKGVSTSTKPYRPVFQENIHNDYEAAPKTPYLPMGKEAPHCFKTPVTSGTEAVRLSAFLDSFTEVPLLAVPQSRRNTVERKDSAI